MSGGYSVPCDISVPVFLQYTDVTARKRTFTTFEFYNMQNPTTDELAQSGFFYHYTYKTVMCYNCGRCLYHIVFNKQLKCFSSMYLQDHVKTDDCPYAPCDEKRKFAYLKYVPSHLLS